MPLPGLLAAGATKLLAPFVVDPYIAEAGTQIVSVPAILTAADPDLRTPVPLGFILIPTLVSPVAEITGLQLQSQHLL